MTDCKETRMDRWRVVIPRTASEILVHRAPKAFSLPEVCVPKNQRLAWHLNDQMRRAWQLEVVSLFPLNIQADTTEPASFRYYVAELLSPNAALPDGIHWAAGASLLTQEAFAEPTDFQAVSAYLRRAQESIVESSPFGQVGWLRRVTTWLQETITPLGLEWRGGFEQFHASPLFSLIRFETTPRATWLKAVGEPNTREFQITRELAKRSPERLPRILAARPQWNAWLAEDCPGKTLDQVIDADLWRRAVRHLAELQIESLAWAQSLLLLGAFDLRTLLTPSLVEHFFELAKQNMDATARRERRELSIDELPLIQAPILRVLHELSHVDVPAALGHLDLNGGNVVLSPERTVFLDWAEACVGPPFLALEYLLQTFRRGFGHGSLQETSIIEAYLTPWESVIPRATVRELWRLTPGLALFAYAQRCALAAEPYGFGASPFTHYLGALLQKLKRELGQYSSLHANG